MAVCKHVTGVRECRRRPGDQPGARTTPGPSRSLLTCLTGRVGYVALVEHAQGNIESATQIKQAFVGQSWRHADIELRRKRLEHPSGHLPAHAVWTNDGGKRLSATDLAPEHLNNTSKRRIKPVVDPGVFVMNRNMGIM